MRPSRYDVIGEGVLRHVDRFAPDDVYDAFYDLLEELMVGPYPDDSPGLGILPVQDDTKPNGFTAPFDAGLLAYQVMRDMPVIKLVDVFWMKEGDEEASGIEYGF